MTPGRTLFGALLLLLAATPPAYAAGGLVLIPDLTTLVINFVVLFALMYPVNRFLLQPLVAVLLEREARTSGALEQAEGFVVEAGEARARIDQLLSDARVEAQSRRHAILSTAEAEDHRLIQAAREAANGELETVRGAVADELESARVQLKTQAQALAREAATQILGREL